MANVVVNVGTAHVTMTGISFFQNGGRYRVAALTLLASPQGYEGIDPVQYFLFCQALELQLKSFIWLKEGKTPMQIRCKYGHNIVKLWDHAKARSIN
jgi:hypothetical protein